MVFEQGDRVRICKPDSEYTGCRGSIVDDPGAAGSDEVPPLGFFVAIDGENGVARPFLLQELELLRAARVRRASAGHQAAGGGVGTER